MPTAAHHFARPRNVPAYILVRREMVPSVALQASVQRRSGQMRKIVSGADTPSRLQALLDVADDAQRGALADG
jgi:hypothetical protein